ncbi:PepSY-associated TM helix domain-containing protein [Gilvimarinus algae]|uniref:PepSY-associated TM helix domain-containing protein n=1 Tax=Gilvimarinus algae TaxID=3058037 RepID=A0ABT8TFD0_9GAMM|nr:PepSY-associated TM helix domain-containing protein [Gilvimarinus sp. SDUM040014]MDO3382224.1 PepSY-associated TM helix domain-containing protein [Gilvimarinus sp. SDUM040014]
MSDKKGAAKGGKVNKKSQWARWSRTLHWTSSALGLVSLLFFSITGITLNHPEWFKADRHTETATLTLEAEAFERWQSASESTQLQQLLSVINDEFGLGVPRQIDRDEVEWFFDYPRPGGVASVVFDVESGEIFYESTSDGAVSLINDLHKGRHSGFAWKLFIDVAALLGIFMSITGIFLLVVYAGKRTSTWPLVGLGLVIPLALYLWLVP